MKLNQAYSKLRRFYIKNYFLLFFSMAFSVMLVTSFALIYFSPTVQTILPEGGDSRKLASMIFIVAVIGCGIFTIYASSLFFKQKSREIGIFMALGTRKRQLSNMLFRDVCTIFVNALDNALEASQKVMDKSRRKIELRVKDEKGIFSFYLMNCKENFITEKDGMLLSDKENENEHGFGVENIRSIVDKYGGKMEITYDDKKFVLFLYMRS